MARDSRLRVGGWVPGRPVPGDGVPPEGHGMDPYAVEGSYVEDAYETHELDVAGGDATEQLIDLGTAPGAALPYAHDATGQQRAYRGRHRGRRPGSTRHLAAAGGVVAAMLIGTFTVVQLASSDPVTLGPPPEPGPEQVVTSPSENDDARLGEAPTATPPPDRSPTAGAGPSGSPAPDPTTPASAPASGDGSYEAEHASGRRGANAEPLAAASGGQVVRLNPHASLEFSQVGADRSGPHRLTVYYAGTGNHTADLSVNGGDPATGEFPGLDSGTVGSVTFWVQLSEGDNTITFYGSGEPGLLLDRIRVTD